MKRRRLLWISLLALGCNGQDRMVPCPTVDGGLPESGVLDAGATGGRSPGSGGVGGSGGTATAGGTGGATGGGSAGVGGRGSGGIAPSGGAAGASGTPSSGGAAGSDAGSGGSDAGSGGSDAGSAGTPSHCTDHRHDGDETDVDCGGSCAGCAPGALCRADSDCGGAAVGCGDQCFCDVATSTCVYDDCFDNKTDALETDFDCGGPLCHPCELGEHCNVDTDCSSAACDVVTQDCVADHCKDHRTDGDESDADCGGATCAACVHGQKCSTSFDCAAGHVCLSKVCN